jgi:uncharacterized membrane protein YgcG
VLALGLAAAAAGAEARSLHWQSLEVEASLEADGRLRVIERQTMVFSGDWNGGERQFRIGPGQRLELHAVRRLDPQTGGWVELRPGNLRSVDDYDWFDRRTLRWRSRLPSDPTFDSSILVYELDYTLFGVVQHEDGNYWLDHDFAFADRVGAIESFRLVLDIDPAWKALPIPGVERQERADGERVSLERGRLFPGRSVVLHFDLERTGAESPAEVRSALPRGARRGVALGTLAAIAFLLFGFFAHERRQRRFESLELPDSLLDSGWLEENLFTMRPEVSGAIHDQRVGPSEVAGVLARLINEKKLASAVEERALWFLKRKVLVLELLVERGEFEDYERRLIDRLFFGGRRETDTDAIRKRYSRTGFDPANSIRGGINRQVRKLPGFSSKLKKASPARSGILFLAGVVAIALESWTRGLTASGIAVALLVLSLLPPVVFGYSFAAIYKRRAERLGLWITLFLLPFAVTVTWLLWAILDPRRFLLDGLAHLGLAGALALVLIFISLLSSVLNRARTRDRKDAVRTRRRLAAVRRAFKSELQREKPALEDDWLPYLLSFGLERQVDRWFRAFGAAAGVSRSRPLSTSSAGGGFGSRPSWSGGGGAFGGAGASATWVSAASRLSSGVAKPSSGGSRGGGGGSSGGGSSSGGGGGGGW